MKISILGGGPAGLYFSILIKKARPDDEVALYERNRADDTFGFGVVFSDQTLDIFRRYDPESHAAILKNFAKVRLFRRTFDSHANQWRFAVEETQIGTEWLLRLDADYWPAHLEAALLFHEKFNEAEGAAQIARGLAINPNAAELHAQGVTISRKHVARLMRLEGLRTRARKRYRCTTMSDRDQPVAASLLDRRFEAE